jgi:hypothetical protein
MWQRRRGDLCKVWARLSFLLVVRNGVRWNCTMRTLPLSDDLCMPPSSPAFLRCSYAADPAELAMLLAHLEANTVRSLAPRAGQPCVRPGVPCDSDLRPFFMRWCRRYARARGSGLRQASQRMCRRRRCIFVAAPMGGRVHAGVCGASASAGCACARACMRARARAHVCVAWERE